MRTLCQHFGGRCVRALIALLVLGSCRLARRRLFEPLASCHVMALSLSYLMLFNPRTLSTSYVMVAGLAAVLAPVYLWRRRPLTAAVFAACALAWNANHHVWGGIEHWHNALACCVFAALLLRETARSNRSVGQVATRLKAEAEARATAG